MKKLRLGLLALFLLLVPAAHAQLQKAGTSVKIDFANSGDNTVISAVTGKRIQIVAMFFTAAGATTITVKDGTGGTALTGAMSIAQTGHNDQLVLPASTSPYFVTSAGNAFVLANANAVQISGMVYYTVGP